MSHTQSDTDWDTVTVLRKSGAQLRQQEKEKFLKGGHNENTQVRYGAAHNKQNTTDLHARKLDENTDGGKHKTVSMETSKAITQARTAKGWKREQLAQQANIKPNVLADYESAKAIPNQQILNKLERLLGVYIRGEKCGQPLDNTPKKK